MSDFKYFSITAFVAFCIAIIIFYLIDPNSIYDWMTLFAGIYCAISLLWVTLGIELDYPNYKLSTDYVIYEQLEFLGKWKKSEYQGKNDQEAIEILVKLRNSKPSKPKFFKI